MNTRADTALDVQVKALLEKSDRSEWHEIAERAEVSHSWLYKFVNGHIDNPGYKTLTRLKSAMRRPRAHQKGR